MSIIKTMLALNRVLISQEYNKKIKWMGLMAVCDESCLCDQIQWRQPVYYKIKKIHYQ